MTSTTTGTSQRIPRELPTLLSSQWDKAIEHKSAFFYPSEIHSITDDATDEWPAVSWSVRRCEALRLKAQEKRGQEREKKDTQETGTTSGQNPTDVFAPPYDPNLLVRELDDHTLLLNKFALIPHHALLVTRGEWEQREYRKMTLD